jgi:hypothetical protein
MTGCASFEQERQNTWDWSKDSACQSGGPLKNNDEPPQKCLMDAFFREQQKLPPHLRSAGAMLVCYCPKCRRFTL